MAAISFLAITAAAILWRIPNTATPPHAPTQKNATASGSDSAIQDLRQQLTEAPTVIFSRTALENFRSKLSSMPKAESLALIKNFLDGKADANTHLALKIAPDGSLKESPTLRTFLLDELARIDPQAAADYAKTILASKDSPDEWALALRNLLRGDLSDEARTLAKSKFMEMLKAEDWQSSPSVGYLEAFDVAVQLGDKDFVPPLTGLLAHKDNQAVAHAAYLSLDRMIINRPTEFLSAMAENPKAMEGRELVRADYFARVDVRDDAQRQLLENYLLNPQLGPAELQQFIGVFPNANFMISPNLLTANKTLDHDTLTARDAASLKAVDQWLADPHFTSLRPQLEQARQRISAFVTQTGLPQ